MDSTPSSSPHDQAWGDSFSSPVRATTCGSVTLFLKDPETATPAPHQRRWAQAQKAEAAFWKHWRQNPLYGHVQLTSFWQDILHKTGGPLPQGRWLDVGCGPVSCLNFVRNPQDPALGLDPLARFYAEQGLVEHAPHLTPMPMVQGTAETLPFLNQSFDGLVCFNVLDHVARAPQVLDELFRVLRPGGEARFYVHTFRGAIKHFLFFDRPHVYHWEHCEFLTLVRQAGFQILQDKKEPKGFDLPRHWWRSLAFFPYWLATKLTFTTYLQVIKPKSQ
jgi:SAM-dependent methyltransferase